MMGMLVQDIMLVVDPEASHTPVIRDAWAFMWGKNALRSWTQPELNKYLTEGFHPNDIDQRDLILSWQEDFPEIAALQIPLAG
jgi:predicted metal-dependent hydrolase